mmetsp:Transcript_26320/g.25166  ORF Transcript_26320/g.25166 Transcript_26320/m.25166 type:complete len:225 (+) Transcript_26320:132-806(+)
MQKRAALFLTRRFCSKIPQGEPSLPVSKYNVWAKYLVLLKEKPMLTKCVTSGVLSCIADIICQIQFPDPSTEKKKQGIDYWRVLKFTGIGTFFVGPTLHYWYGFLSLKFPGSTLLNTIQRLAVDQLIFAPCFIPTFFAVILILDGKPELIFDKIKNEWLSTMKTNFAVWVPAMFINFKFVPPTLQVLFSNFIGFGWNIYLSKISYQTEPVPSTELSNESGKPEQ